VKVVIVPTDGARLTAQEIQAYCKSQLAVYKVPSIVEFRDQLPKSMVGKVLRRLLREEAGPSQSPPP
jgi:long-chain acyl-CoA synthetase